MFNSDHFFPTRQTDSQCELLFSAKSNIVPRYSLRATPGFSADCAQMHMVSECQVLLRTRAKGAHMRVLGHARTQAWFRTPLWAVGEAMETTDSQGETLTVGNFLVAFWRAKRAQERRSGPNIHTAGKSSTISLINVLTSFFLFFYGAFEINDTK